MPMWWVMYGQGATGQYLGNYIQNAIKYKDKYLSTCFIHLHHIPVGLKVKQLVCQQKNKSFFLCQK